MWSQVLYFSMVLTLVVGKSSKSIFSAGIVEDIVKNEIQKKMPSATHPNKKSLKGFHLKEATDAINKLVDESIVDRVQEAEREVSKMLLKSIEHHIQDAGKVLLQQDENACRDKLESCEKLADSGVCETSKDAMIVNCPKTCNFCGMLKELKQEKTKEDEEASAVISKPKKKKKKKHRHHHHHLQQKEFQQTSKLNPEETQQIHQNMIDQTIDHANLPMAVDNTPEQQTSAENSPAQTAEPVQQESNDARDSDANQQQQQQDDADAERQREEEEEEERQKAEEDRQREEDRRQREEQRREKERRKKKKAAAKQQAASIQTKENYFASQCHPLCAKECIASCAPGCCDHRIPVLNTHIQNRKRCHPMCKKICLPSCGVGCCAPGIKTVPQQQAGMCPPGCPLPCAPHCLDSCCFPRPQPPPALPAIGLPLCLGTCINSCDSSCPPSCCPSNMEVSQCPAPCGGSCAPSCTPECCGIQLPGLPLPPPRKPDVQLPSYPIPAPLPEAFDVCPGLCPKSCAPGCEFDCCKPFLDPGVVQQMSPSQNELPSIAPPAPPMSRVIHVQHVLSPQQEIATAPAVSEVPATCPAECQQHCGPACARDGCCTDKKRKRSKIPRASSKHQDRNFFEHSEFEYGEPFFYVDEQ